MADILTRYTKGAVQQADDLVVDSKRIVTRGITLATGAGSVARGSVLGKVTADGKYKVSLSAAVDGSETPDAIAVHTEDISGGDVATVAYFGGDFNEDSSLLSVGTAHTVASIREGLRAKNIVLHKASRIQ